MFWFRNKKNNFQLHTLIWGPGKIINRTGVKLAFELQKMAFFCYIFYFPFVFLRKVRLEISYESSATRRLFVRNINPYLVSRRGLEIENVGWAANIYMAFHGLK